MKEYSSTTDHDIQKQIWKLLGKQVIIKLRRETSSSCIPPKIVLLHISKEEVYKKVSVSILQLENRKKQQYARQCPQMRVWYKYHMHVSHPMLFNTTNNATIMYTCHVAYIRMNRFGWFFLIFFTKPNYPVFLFSKPTPTVEKPLSLVCRFWPVST